MNLKAKRDMPKHGRKKKQRIRRLTGSAKEIVRNDVFVEEPYIQSRASYIELIRKFHKDTKHNWWQWLKFRDEWMMDQYRKFGVLTCCHCKRTNLRFSGNRSDVATIDHIIPTSLGGPKYDTTNFQIMCSKCNSKRGNMTMEEFKTSYPGGKNVRNKRQTNRPYRKSHRRIKTR